MKTFVEMTWNDPYMGLIEPRLQASGKDSLDRIELKNVVRCATRLSGPGA